MDGLRVVIGEILNSSPEIRENILSACSFLKPVGDEKIIIDAISSLPLNFTFLQLYDCFPEKNRRELMSYCMKAATSDWAKSYISKKRIKKDTKHINVFKRFL